jgi:2,3-dihydroxybenzoate-AMP ligase
LRARRIIYPNPTPADEVAFFQLSGGSTGTPKLIPRTHNDYDYSIRRSNEICGITAETRYLNALPAAHNYAMSSPGSLGVFPPAAAWCWRTIRAPRSASR